MLAAGVAIGLRQLVGLDPVDAPFIGEKQYPVMRGRDEEVRDDVVGLQASTLDTLPPAPLSPIQVGLRALRVARSSDRDDDIFLSDQVLDTDVTVVRDDPGATLIAVLLDDLGQLVPDDLTLPAGPGQDVVVVVDLGRDPGVLIDDPLPFE